MSDSLEQASEREMIPLVFVGMDFDGKSRYQRLDTKEVLVGRVRILMPERFSVITGYSGEGTIKMAPPLEEADGLIFPCVPKGRTEKYICNYGEIYPEQKKEEDGVRRSGGFSIVTK